MFITKAETESARRVALPYPNGNNAPTPLPWPCEVLLGAVLLGSALDSVFKLASVAVGAGAVLVVDVMESVSVLMAEVVVGVSLSAFVVVGFAVVSATTGVEDGDTLVKLR